MPIFEFFYQIFVDKSIASYHHSRVSDEEVEALALFLEIKSLPEVQFMSIIFNLGSLGKQSIRAALLIGEHNIAAGVIDPLDLHRIESSEKFQNLIFWEKVNPKHMEHCSPNLSLSS